MGHHPVTVRGPFSCTGQNAMATVAPSRRDQVVAVGPSQQPTIRWQIFFQSSCKNNSPFVALKRVRRLLPPPQKKVQTVVF